MAKINVVTPDGTQVTEPGSGDPVILGSYNIWTNADADNDGNNANNWLLGHVPTAAEIAYFTDATFGGSEDDCTLSGSLSCYGIDIRPEYGGAFDPNGQDITTVADFLIALGDHIVDGADVWNGSTVVVGGRFSAVGASDNLVNLRASTGWTLTVTGRCTASYATVAGCDASGGTRLTATDSTEGAGNTDVVFLESQLSDAPISLVVGIA